MGASSRLRFQQFENGLAAASIFVTYRPLLSDSYLRKLYSTGKRSKAEYIKAFFRRTFDVLDIRSFDVVWLEGELFPWWPTVIERMILQRARAVVIDYDDPQYLRYATSGAAWSGKIDVLMRTADVVIAANPTLFQRAVEVGAKKVELLPTVVNCEGYPLGEAVRREEQLVVGWVGSPQTAQYLNEVTPVLVKLAGEGLVNVRIVGAPPPDEKSPFTYVAWSEQTEAFEIGKFDIGIAPLPDEEWAKGQSGLKLVQYMAAGKPVIASPVGVNTNMFSESGGGLLASTPNSWENAIRRLASQERLRREMGQRGRAFVQQGFCVRTALPKLVQVLLSFDGQASCPRERAVPSSG